MQNALAQIFTFADAAPLSEGDEIDTIAAAQAGDEAATMRLVEAYGPALRSAVSTFSHGVRGGADAHAGDLGVGTAAFDVADVQAAALVAFLEVIAEHDPARSPRLAGAVRRRLARELADLFEVTMPFRVPERTLSRFYGILSAADGDEALAEEIAPDYSMSRETFRDVLAAVRHTGSLDATLDDTPGESTGRGREVTFSPVYSTAPITDAEDAVLVEIAFSAVDDEEERICRLAYGFTEYEPQPDAEVAHRMGLSRPAVQRKRGKALDKMRKTLAATLAD